MLKKRIIKKQVYLLVSIRTFKTINIKLIKI